MMVETVADVALLHHGAQNANALILMEAGVEQLALKQQLVQWLNQLHHFRLQQELLYLQFLDPLVILLKTFILKIIKSSQYSCIGENKEILKTFQNHKK